MTEDKLPPYFENYLDEKFGNVNQKFTGVIKELRSVRKLVATHIKNTKKDGKERDERILKNESDISRLKTRIVIGLLALSPIFIKESRDWGVHLILGLFGI